MSYLKVKNLTTRVGSFKLDGITFEMQKGEFLSIIGRSGSGKTVFLESIAGVHKVEGSIILNGRDITHLPPEKRAIGMVYQDCMLFPNLNVEKNILYPTRFNKSADKHLFYELIAFFKIEKLLKRDVKTLSGGEKQKVAIARALMSNPELLLLDEPLNAIDFSFRWDFIQFLKELHRRYRLTVIYVTHNIKEAIQLSNRTLVMLNGRIQQSGTTEEVLEKPASKDIAEFLGFKNILPARLLNESSNGHFSVNPWKIELSNTPNRDYSLQGKIVEMHYANEHWQVKVEIDGNYMFVYTAKKPIHNLVVLNFDKKDIAFLDDRDEQAV